ncbi:MAG TPA: S46 family peptidase, partial [Caulobacteraceae bacterium]
ALAIDPAARAIAREVNQRVNGPVAAAHGRIARARFAAYGDAVYPDATFSLRLSYGRVAGWSERGRTVTPFTTFTGLYERDTGQRPFDLPDSWGRARERVDMDTVFNFSGTLDVIGGASGSPTLNARGEVIGAVFDGNIHSLGGAYGYDPELNRSVHVAASGIQEALLKVYDQPHLVAELNGR